MKYDSHTINKRKSLSNKIKKLLYIFIIIILYNVILLSVSYIDKFETPKFYIYKAYIITTESMSPTINSGDVIIIKKCKEEDLKIGDIVTFKQNGETITHKITDITKREKKNEYTTKGNNNNTEDSKKISFENIEGKQVITIPKLGKMTSFFKNGIIIIIVLLIFLVLYLQKIETEEKREIRRKKKRIEDKKNRK